jgi:transposase
VNVKWITPVLLVALTMISVMTEAICLSFLQNIAARWQRRVLPLAICGKIILTVIRVRRQHGRAAGQAGSQGGGASKLTEEILAWAEEQLAASPALRPAGLPGLIEDAFGVRVHPRSVERALARRRERHSKSRGTARPQDAEGG